VRRAIADDTNDEEEDDDDDDEEEEEDDEEDDGGDEDEEENNEDDGDDNKNDEGEEEEEPEEEEDKEETEASKRGIGGISDDDGHDINCSRQTTAVEGMRQQHSNHDGRFFGARDALHTQAISEIIEKLIRRLCVGIILHLHKKGMKAGESFWKKRKGHVRESEGEIDSPVWRCSSSLFAVVAVLGVSFPSLW
jgi:hypothetical protein